jgi:2-amino-4-hydroxy-6-hydroxymethyldihydropteridine diphosphokinase
MATAYVGLGSNIGDAAAHLSHACALLHQHPAIAVEAVSSLYRSAPVGVTDQAWFVNAVARLQTNLSPRSLLAVTQAVERRVGRTPTYRWGPRVVDLDLLLYDDLQLQTRYLTIPHAAMLERAFVLIPLYELAPHLCLPSGHSIKTLLDTLPSHEDVQPIGAFYELPSHAPFTHGDNT